MIVRQASEADLDGLAPLFDQYRQFYGQAPDPAGAREFLRLRLTRRESVVFVAERESGTELLGFTQLYPTFSSVSGGSAWVLNDLYVLPSARRLGAARALLERARRFGVETGACYLELLTGVTNLAAQQLYQQSGWRRDQDFYRYELDLRHGTTGT
jgi:ribosomal protein S18 acetylase RimI-like enzyme